MKRVLMPLLATLALLSGSAAAAELKIGFVDYRRLLEESPQAQSAQQAMQQQIAPMQREMAAQQKELRALEERLSRDGSIMSDTERRDTERRIRDLQRDMTRKQNEYMEDINILRNEELAKVQRAIGEEVQRFAREQKFDLLLGDAVLFASPAVDVTEDLLSWLDRAYRQGGGQ